MRELAAALVVLAGALVFVVGVAAQCAYDNFGRGASSAAPPAAMLCGVALGLVGLGFLASAFYGRRP